MTTTRSVLFAALAVAICTTVFPPLASAAGGRYVFDGGTAQARREVALALAASDFDWSLVPDVVVIHIRRGVDSAAAPGHIWLDADLLDADRFAWGVVQHEYAHQVDFQLLEDPDRRLLLGKLGGDTWCADDAHHSHEQLGCERFASTLAWSYWQSPENCMKPERRGDESSALPPAQFRRLMATLIRGWH